MDAETKKTFLAEVGVPSAIPKIITTGYHTLQLIHFFTAGPKEVRCWTIRVRGTPLSLSSRSPVSIRSRLTQPPSPTSCLQKGTFAPDAAGVIHTDFRDGFVCAEVMAFTDFKEHGNETAVKAAGLFKQQGKKYVVNDGDIIFFKTNTGAGLGKKKK